MKEERDKTRLTRHAIRVLPLVLAAHDLRNLLALHLRPLVVRPFHVKRVGTRAALEAVDAQRVHRGRAGVGDGERIAAVRADWVMSRGGRESVSVCVCVFI